MEQNDFLYKFIKNADNLMQSTLKDFLEKNPTYLRIALEEDYAEAAYIEISSSLTKEHKKIIEYWAEKKDVLNAEYSTMAYIQGYIDCIHLLKILQPNIDMFGDL